jgi:outer membrane protein assembly factor BamB
MSMEHAPSRKPLRLWPGVAAVVVQWLAMFVVPIFVAGFGGTGILVGVACGLIVVLWWLFLSRAPWLDRLMAIVVMVAAVAAIAPLLHASITGGMMGFMRFVYSIPLLSLGLVVSAVATRGLSPGLRRVSMAAALFLAVAGLALVRTNGLSGDAASDFEWRWKPTAEQELLAAAPASEDAPVQPIAPAPAPAPVPAPAEAKADLTPPVVAEPVVGRVERVEWPGFRGPRRDGVIRGTHLETDWSKTPPAELWRHPIGPGWSSFAVGTDRIYTQEQRGEDEIVSAYELKTGKPVWRHRDAARFWESNAGAGPRGTPTLSNGRVYALGATGIVNALNESDGSVIWSRNAASDTGRKVPDWGIASSPLVVDDLVIVATAGWLAAYDASTGKPRWFGPKEGGGYSSPHLVTIDGVQQVVLVNGPGVIGVNPADGTVLWKYDWSGDSIVQPVVLADGDFLIGSGSGLAGKTGVARVTVTHTGGPSTSLGASQWTVKERWTTTGLKPYFNDFVAHAGHAFGFDGGILACINLEDGSRKWKGGRYGHGQLVLLPDQNLLLVVSEDGELALVSATADKFTEIAKVPAIEGKTWNHPVLVGDTLLVRNGEEMAAFRLRLAGAR